MAETLKNCPKCNSQADVHGTQKTTGYYWVKCIECNVRTHNYKNRIDAETAWNNDKLISA